MDRPTYHQVCDTEYVQDCDGGGYQVIFGGDSWYWYWYQVFVVIVGSNEKELEGADGVDNNACMTKLMMSMEVMVMVSDDDE